MKTFQVPVWFNITAENQEIAWQKIQRLMEDFLPVDLYNHKIDDFVVEEPVDVSDIESGFHPSTKE